MTVNDGSMNSGEVSKLEQKILSFIGADEKTLISLIIEKGKIERLTLIGNVSDYPNIIVQRLDVLAGREKQNEIKQKSYSASEVNTMISKLYGRDSELYQKMHTWQR